MVRLAERQVQFAHQPVGQIGRGREARAGGGGHPFGVGTQRRDHGGHGVQGQVQGVEGLEHRRLVLLHVLGIGQRKTLHHRGQGDQRAHDPARLGPHQFGGVGVALLRHDGRAGGQVVRQGGETEHRRHPDHDLLGQARQVARGDRGCGQAFQREVAVGHGVQTVGHRALEAQVLRRHMAVDGEG